MVPMELPLLSRRFDVRALALVSAEVAKHYRVMPISTEGDRKLLVALADPGAASEIGTITNREIEAVRYPEEEILRAIESVYGAKPPGPVSSVDERAPSIDLGEVLDAMRPALRRRPFVASEPYAWVGGGPDLAIALADQFLAQGAAAQTRLYWDCEGLHEQRGGRLCRTSVPPERLLDDCLRQLRLIAGLPRNGKGPAHSRFEMDFGGWRFSVDAMFVERAALLEFHAKESSS